MRREDVAVYRSFEEAEAAERAYYLSLTPQERLDILLELIAREAEATGEAEQRLARVHRVVALGSS